MASSAYHRKQAEILAGLALTAPDRATANQFSLLALEHRNLAEQRNPDALLIPRDLSEDDNREPA